MRAQRKEGLGFLVAAALATALVLTGCSPSSTDNGNDAGDGASLKVGYISLGDSVPFVKLVSDSIKAEAEAAGVELLFCDSQLDAAKALACAQNFKTQGVDGIINFQVDETAAESICAAGPDVPVVAIDIHQRPCEKVFVGADNYTAGFIAGEALGTYFQENFDCEYDAFVSMEQPAAGQVNLDRTGGAIEGFESVCGALDDSKYRSVDGGGTIDGGNTTFGDTLTALTGAQRVAVVSLNDDMLLGAFAAARAQGREGAVYGVAQGADPSSFDDIQNNPNWIGDTAYFPERYGELAIPSIISLINGETVPENVFTEHVFIDASNFAEFY
ncbi:sugar ABC transporter substrate-binding protein [Antiquaquibacter soli]|uniref:Sugar ABC transporter substrate-binding protein n=1 Tax=Antiquaquibacter soli TaxID=3064523 RepID=A0ABT9BLT1_9MICO|nr:sugar ABC transporter substrate-binding protein [Protaetiibacter sp. WY-16]MDO7881559.1 sugar ABC transporter substrate-binding protein [Protaetiibacter sp. WY-16]